MLAVTFQNPELIGQNYQTLVELFFQFSRMI